MSPKKAIRYRLTYGSNCQDPLDKIFNAIIELGPPPFWLVPCMASAKSSLQSLFSKNNDKDIAVIHMFYNKTLTLSDKMVITKYISREIYGHTIR